MRAEKRTNPRVITTVPVQFRIVREGKSSQISESVIATMRDLSIEGLAMDTSRIEVNGIHVSYDEHPSLKNRLYLHWKLPRGKSIKAVGETVWYERRPTEKPSFVVGLRFVEISREDRKALAQFLEDSGETVH